MLPARVLVEHRGAYSVLTARGQLWAQVTGKLRHDAVSRADLPTTGDWVVAEIHDGDQASIHAVLSRRTRFSRNIAGKATDEHVIAANIDVSFLVASLEHEVNLRRIERYLTLAWSGGTDPVIVLTKSDLAGDPEDIVYELERVESIALGVPVLLTSSATGAGLEDLRDILAGSRTGVLLGSSGAGKSSLVNALLGDTTQQVDEVRNDGKGRHTTARRELIALPGGGVIVDTPGLRGLKLWDHGEGAASTFADVAELAGGCKFNDCRHESEPGCAVRAAIADGTIGQQRLDDWRKLQRELEYQRSKQDQRLAAQRKQRWKKVENSLHQVTW
jgi:ribosome biogenesis GTPase